MLYSVSFHFGSLATLLQRALLTSKHRTNRELDRQREIHRKRERAIERERERRTGRIRRNQAWGGVVYSTLVLAFF